MNIATVAITNLRRRPLRTFLLSAIVAIAAATLFSAAVLLAGVDRSLQQASARLGADILVVPRDAEAPARTALLAGEPGRSVMQRSVVDRVRNLKGVSAATPQLFLKPRALPCCYDVNVFLLAFDPETDLTVRPWLDTHLRKPLSPDEVITGGAVPAAPGDMLPFFGTLFTVAGGMEPTGIDVFDRSIFMTLDAAYRMAEVSPSRSPLPITLGKDDISAVLVRVDDGVPPDRAAIQIEFSVPGVKAVTAQSVLATVRKQMGAAGRAVIVLGTALWIGVLLVMGFAFSMAVHERGRAPGIRRLRDSLERPAALLLAAESSLLCLLGGIAGVAAGGFLIAAGRGLFAGSFLVLPGLPLLSLLALAVVVLAVLTGLVASLVSARAFASREPVGTAGGME